MSGPAKISCITRCVVSISKPNVGSAQKLEDKEKAKLQEQQAFQLEAEQLDNQAASRRTGPAKVQSTGMLVHGITHSSFVRNIR